MKIYLLLLTIALTACGDDSKSGDNDENNASSEISSDTNASLNDVIGIWNVTDIDEDGTEDEGYLVIKDSGDLLYYDYRGDSADNGSNCYALKECEVEFPGGKKMLCTENTDENVYSYTVKELDDGYSFINDDPEDRDFHLSATTALESDFETFCNVTSEKPSLEDISGVWVDTDEGATFAYFIISINGDIDFYHESNDEERVCHNVYKGSSITDQGDGVFDMIFLILKNAPIPYRITASILENELTMVGEGNLKVVAQRSETLTKNDFGNICPPPLDY